jgi:hypothetical protein
MTLASGLGSQLGAAKETTWATVVTPTRFFEFNSESLNRTPAYQESVGLRANRMFQPASRVVQTTRTAGGDIALDVPTKGYGFWLDLLHGLTVTPVQQASTPAWKQAHLVGTSMPSKSATLQVNKPDSGGNDHPFTYPGSVVTGATWSCDVGGLLTSTVTVAAQDELTPASTPGGSVAGRRVVPGGHPGVQSHAGDHHCRRVCGRGGYEHVARVGAAE